VLGGGFLSSVVDRVRPRRLVSGCDAISAVIVALMAVPSVPVPVLLALLFGVGTLSSVGGGARTALVRSTVPASAYVPARSLMKIAGQLAQVGGSALGGALLVAVGTSTAILVNAASFALSAALVRLVVADHANDGTAARAGLIRDSLRGAREILGHPELARLLLLGWLVPMFSVAPEAVAAPYISSQHGSAGLVGWWLAALPVGTIAGDLLGVRFLGPSLQRRLVVPAAAASFVPYLVFAAWPPIGVCLALLVVSGAFGMYSLGLDGRVRDAAPDRLFARTMTLNSAGLMTLQGAGFALAGALAQAIGAGPAVAALGACGLLAVAALSLGRRRPDRSVAFG
jgi:predicted MFS family arabinose efflux permease